MHDGRRAGFLQFAVVVLVIIMLLYGTVTLGLILAAKFSLSKAAGGALRSGISSTPVATDKVQAGRDVGWRDFAWMDKGACGTSDTAITGNAEKTLCPSTSNQECPKVTLVQ